MVLSRTLRICIAVGVVSAAVAAAHAGIHRTYVTGEVGGSDVIFEVILDPAVAGSAAVSVAATDKIRLDGIDYLPGTTSEVVVGAQLPSDGSIPTYNVDTGVKLADLVPLTGAGTRPSSVLTLGSHVYYTENQFGFAGPAHRIMRTPVAGPPGTVAIVFDGAAGGGLANFEGLEVFGERLYFFARDDVVATDRALYSIALSGVTGLSDGTPPVKHLGGLAGGPSGDGSDELDYDPVTGQIYGTNMFNGEVIAWDPVVWLGGGS